MERGERGERRERGERDGADWEGGRRRLASRLASGVAGLAGVAWMAGCGPLGPGQAPAGGGATGTAAPPGGPPRRLRIGTSFVVTNMVPGDNPQWHSTYGVAQTLYRILPDDRLAPWVASSIAPDGQEGYTIKLDPRARFHNGKRIDAQAVQACIERHLARGIQVPSLRGARWEVPDPGTLRVKTAEPDPWLPQYLSTAASFPLFDVSEVPEGGDPAALVGRGFYSGPFRATALTPEQLTLEAVPEAWDGAPRLAGVEVRFIRDPLARFNALRTGEIDLILYTPSDALPQIKATPGMHFKATPTAELVWVQLNHRRPPFDQVAVRQALALGIDRQPIAATVLNGAYDAPDTIYPAAMPWALKGAVRYDAAGARKVLEDAGWRAGPDGIRVKEGRRLAFELTHYPQQPDSKPMAEALQAQLKGIGFEVRLKQVEDTVAVFRSREYDAGIRYNSMQKTGNPMSVLNTSFRTDSVGNEGSWGSPELDGIIRRLNVEFDERARLDLLRQVQERFRQDVPITFTVSKRWSATVNADYADYVPPHDNHAYVVTKETAPVAQGARR